MNKKICAILLAMLLVIGFLPATSTAETLPEKGTLVIHKYIMDNTVEAGQPGNGTENVNIPVGAEPIEGIVFNLYKVEAAADGSYPGDGPYTVTATTVTDGNGNTFGIAAAATPAVTTLEDGSATAADLPMGIYLAVEQADARIAVPAAPFVVSVPMADPNNAGAWLNPVHVYPKNESIAVTKTVDVDAVQVGSPVVYTITVDVPTTIQDAISYAITDQLDAALDFVSATVKADGVTIVSGFTVTPTVATTGGPLVKVDFSDDLASLNGVKQIEVTIHTVVNDSILNADDFAISNEAKLEFTNQFGEEKEFSSVDNPDLPTQPTIHTAAIQITKTDAATGDSITSADAKFVIASSKENADARNFLHIDPVTNKLIDFGEEGYAEAQLWEVTTNAEGIALFKGILDYTLADETKTYLHYWIMETQAPAGGYRPLTDPVEVVFDSTINESTVPAYTLQTTVANSKEFTLPNTGGMGTLLFTVGGIALIGLAMILIIVAKKRKSTENEA